MKQVKHWQDSLNAVLGIWLFTTPVVLGFQNDVPAYTNAVLVGLALLASGFGAIFFPRAWEEWTQTALGLWLTVSPWVLQFSSYSAKASAVVTGLVVLTLALWALQDKGVTPSEGTAH